jgi:hypothetical protein
MPRTKWKQDGIYAFRRGRRPLRLAVFISTHNRWTGVLEWFPLPSTKEPHRIPLTRRYASHENAMEAAEKALVRFKTALERLV